MVTSGGRAEMVLFGVRNAGWRPSAEILRHLLCEAVATKDSNMEHNVVKIMLFLQKHEESSLRGVVNALHLFRYMVNMASSLQIPRVDFCPEEDDDEIFSDNEEEEEVNQHVRTRKFFVVLSLAEIFCKVSKHFDHDAALELFTPNMELLRIFEGDRIRAFIRIANLISESNLLEVLPAEFQNLKSVILLERGYSQRTHTTSVDASETQTKPSENEAAPKVSSDAASSAPENVAASALLTLNMNKGKNSKGRRCHNCKGCLRKTNCNQCFYCRDRISMGGSGKLRKGCILRMCLKRMSAKRRLRLIAKQRWRAKRCKNKNMQYIGRSRTPAKKRTAVSSSNTSQSLVSAQKKRRTHRLRKKFFLKSESAPGFHHNPIVVELRCQQLQKLLEKYNDTVVVGHEKNTGTWIWIRGAIRYHLSTCMLNATDKTPQGGYWMRSPEQSFNRDPAVKIWFIANKNWGNKSIHIKPMIMKEISTAFEYSISKAIEKAETARKDQQSGSEEWYYQDNKLMFLGLVMREIKTYIK